MYKQLVKTLGSDIASIIRDFCMISKEIARSQFSKTISQKVIEMIPSGASFWIVNNWFILCSTRLMPDDLKMILGVAYKINKINKLVWIGPLWLENCYDKDTLKNRKVKLHVKWSGQIPVQIVSYFIIKTVEANMPILFTRKVEHEELGYPDSPMEQTDEPSDKDIEFDESCQP